MNVYLHDIQSGRPADSIGARRANVDVLAEIEALLERADTQVELSIDDGYASSVNIVPILEKYRVNCTLFVTTGFVDGSVYPYELVLSWLLERRDHLIDLEGVDHDTGADLAKETLFRQLHLQLKPLGEADRKAVLRALLEANNAAEKDVERVAYLSPDAVRELDSHPLLDIGSHTYSHLVLPSQSYRVIYSELRRSRSYLEQLLGRRVTKLSYPYGASSPATRALAALAGYRRGYGTAADSASRFNLPRLSLHEAALNG